MTNASDLMSEVKKGGAVMNLRLPFTLRCSSICAQAIYFIVDRGKIRVDIPKSTSLVGASS